MASIPSNRSKSPTARSPTATHKEEVEKEDLAHARAEENQTQQQTYRQVAAAHIDTLNEVNRQVPKMLTYFAIALAQLTNNPIQERDQEGKQDTLQDRQAAFRKYAIFVGMSVNLIREELSKQIYALEAHKVIPKRNFEGLKQGQNSADKDAFDTEKEVRNAGYGEFDVGVLNARVASGQGSEEDVLDRVKAIIEELKKHGIEEKNGDEMVVDG